MTSATLPATGIVHHTALLPLSEGSVAIDHVLGAMNYRSLRADEVRSTQVNFRHFRETLYPFYRPAQRSSFGYRKSLEFCNYHCAFCCDLGSSAST